MLLFAIVLFPRILLCAIVLFPRIRIFRESERAFKTLRYEAKLFHNEGKRELTRL